MKTMGDIRIKLLLPEVILILPHFHTKIRLRILVYFNFSLLKSPIPPSHIATSRTSSLPAPPRPVSQGQWSQAPRADSHEAAEEVAPTALRVDRAHIRREAGSELGGELLVPGKGYVVSE